MLKTIKGSIDGIHTKEFKEGQVYKCPSEISEYLVNAWEKQKIVEKIEKETKIVKNIETKEPIKKTRINKK